MSDSRSKSLRGLLSTCAWGALAAAIGCGGGGSDGPPSTTVTGTRLSTYWQDDGSTISVAPTDTGGVTISALVYENGAYRESMGTTDGSGNLTITDVGTGAYFLRYASPGAVPRYYLESARRLDLGADQVGRTTRPIAQLATPVTFSVTGLDPWAAGDAVSLFTTGGRFGTGMTGAPLAGDTAGDFTVDFKSRPLPQANDLGWVLQTAPRTAGAGAVPYTAVVRSVAIQTLESLPDGTAVTLGPLPLTVPPQGTVGMDLRRSQFLAALPSMAPSATVTSTTFNFGVSAVPRSFSLFYSGFYRSMLNGSLPAGTTDVDLGSLSYSRPFTPWFTELRSVDYNVNVLVPAALGAPAATVLYQASRLDKLPGAPAVVAPSIGPARLPLIAGKDALQPQSGVGLTPTFSWSPPATGTPTRYAVSIMELGGATAMSRATIVLNGTSFVIPPALLQAGKVYVAGITTIYEPGYDMAVPFRYAVPRELVPFVTAPFAP